MKPTLTPPRTLVLATSRHTHGGITSVVKAHSLTPAWSRHRCRWIATHRSGPMALKLLYLLTGMMQYLALLPWCRTVHMHIGEAPSARRKALFMRLAKALGKRTIVHFHAFDTVSTIDGPWREVYMYLFTRADLVVALSPGWQQKLDLGCGLGPKVVTLYNPAPQPPHTDSPAAAVPEAAPYILSAAVIAPRKGYRELLEAFATLSPRYPSWRLVLAGSGETGIARNLARNLGIEDKVELPGWVAGERKARLMAGATIFTLPSHAEGFPMGVLEAWAYGTPVVATPVGALPEILDRGCNGHDAVTFTPAGDSAALARALESLMAAPALRARTGAAGKALAAEAFSPAAIGEQLDEIYTRLG